jgi:hypothetical protein
MMYLVWTLYMNLWWCILYEHCTWTYDDVSYMNIVHELTMMYLAWTLYMNFRWCILHEHCTWTYDDVSCMNIVHDLTMMCLVWTLYMNLRWCVLYEHCTWTYNDVSCMNIVHELTMMYLVWTLYMNLRWCVLYEHCKGLVEVFSTLFILIITERFLKGFINHSWQTIGQVNHFTALDCPCCIHCRVQDLNERETHQLQSDQWFKTLET